MTTLLIDGDNLLHRSYWISQQNVLTNSKGVDTGTVFTFLRAVKSYVAQFKASKVYLAWDKKLQWPSTNFRKQACLEYKATRDQTQAVSTHQQQDLITEALNYLGVHQIQPNTMEADDVISWLASQVSDNVVIVSSDKDMLQLVTERVHVYNAISKKLCTVESFEAITDTRREHFLLTKAIMGDSSDNIKGVRGFGPVKAKKLAYDWEAQSKSLTPEQLEVVNTNLRLMDLSIGYTIAEGEVEAYQRQFNAHTTRDFAKFQAFCTEHEFLSIVENIGDWTSIFSGNFDPGRQMKISTKKS